MPRWRTHITPVDEKTTGRRERELRTRRGLSPAAVAEQLGIDQTLAANYGRCAARLRGAVVAEFPTAPGPRRTNPQPQATSRKGGAVKGRLLRRVERIAELPHADQRAVLNFLDAPLDTRQRRTA